MRVWKDEAKTKNETTVSKPWHRVTSISIAVHLFTKYIYIYYIIFFIK